MVDPQQHWEGVYSNKESDQVSWFQPHAASSLRLIEGCTDMQAHVIDVGGGASVLVDDLLDAGYRHLTRARSGRIGAGRQPPTPGRTRSAGAMDRRRHHAGGACLPRTTMSGTTARCFIS